MAKFHTLTIADIRRETADAVSVAFEVPAPLKEEFKYIQGQYLTLKLIVNGQEIRRSYSICSSPDEAELRIAIKKVREGRGSIYLNDIARKGDKIEVMTPMGNFYSTLDPSHKKHYVLFAGGSGITPMLSILKTTLKAEPSSNISLFYGNLDEAATIFRAQLEALASANSNRLKVYHILDRPAGEVPELHKGIMTVEKVKALLEAYVPGNTNNEYFVCGPGVMMDNVKNALTAANVDKERIHIEYFAATPEVVKPTLVEAQKGNASLSKVTVILDGSETHFELGSGGDVILDAALDAGVDVPFACKGAVCCTCRAKLVEGKVKMDANYALTDSEVANGFILTCQSHPLTPVVVVDYDQQ